MRTTCISLLMAALMALPHTVTAQISLRDIFTQMPDSLLPTLSRSDRLDLLDFIDANLTNEVPGALRGSARLTMLTPSVLKLRLSPHAEMQMCLLSDQATVCVITSVEAGGWDSSVRFYNLGWQMLDVEAYIDLPTTTDFIPRPDSMTDNDYRNLLVAAGIPFIKADINDASTISFTYTSGNNADAQSREKLKPYITPVVERKISIPRQGI